VGVNIEHPTRRKGMAKEDVPRRSSAFLQLQFATISAIRVKNVLVLGYRRKKAAPKSGLVN
jgi:hypothetical protein